MHWTRLSPTWESVACMVSLRTTVWSESTAKFASLLHHNLLTCHVSKKWTFLVTKYLSHEPLLLWYCRLVRSRASELSHRAVSVYPVRIFYVFLPALIISADVPSASLFPHLRFATNYRLLSGSPTHWIPLNADWKHTLPFYPAATNHLCLLGDCLCQYSSKQLLAMLARQ